MLGITWVSFFNRIHFGKFFIVETIDSRIKLFLTSILVNKVFVKHHAIMILYDQLNCIFHAFGKSDKITNNFWSFLL